VKTKKNIFVLLSFFIVVMFIFTLFGRNSSQTLQDRIEALETWKESIDKWKPKLNLLVSNGLGLPGYDSGWKVIGQGKNLELIHNLGGNSDNYVVDLQFMDSGGKPHQMFYGGEISLRVPVALETFMYQGAYWKNLSNSHLIVYRRQDDSFVEKVRVRIWKY